MIILKLTFLIRQGEKLIQLIKNGFMWFSSVFFISLIMDSAQYYRILGYIAPFSWIGAKRDGCVLISLCLGNLGIRLKVYL
jgi:hypothetical protein